MMQSIVINDSSSWTFWVCPPPLLAALQLPQDTSTYLIMKPGFCVHCCYMTFEERGIVESEVRVGAGVEGTIWESFM